MELRHVLVTGGAGFVGSSLAVALKRAHENLRVTALDSLRRRGSELSLERLRAHGVAFVHGDVRVPEDLEQVRGYDALVDCSAEPSVHAGLDGAPLALLDTNLRGSLLCLEAARRNGAAFLLLSTSRVYPIAALEALPWAEAPTRFRWTPAAGTSGTSGFSSEGVAEDFGLAGTRSLYGASKLAVELAAQEYRAAYGVPVLIDRCGVIAGPWQMGRVDQGFVALWVARHAFGERLRYVGYGGSGKQVRDVLHVEDLAELVVAQLARLDLWDGRVYNVGGGPAGSVSLLELTELCRAATRRTVPIDGVAATSPVDLRIFVTDARRVREQFGWRPARDPARLVDDVARWVGEHQEALRPILSGGGS